MSQDQTSNSDNIFGTTSKRQMKCSVMAEGIFSPDPSPYLTEELEQHLDQLGQAEEEDDF